MYEFCKKLVIRFSVRPLFLAQYCGFHEYKDRQLPLPQLIGSCISDSGWSYLFCLIFFLLSFLVSPLLHTHCSCKGLLLHLLWLRVRIVASDIHKKHYIHVPDRIRTRNPKKRAAAELRLRARYQRDRLVYFLPSNIYVQGLGYLSRYRFGHEDDGRGIVVRISTAVRDSFFFQSVWTGYKTHRACYLVDTADISAKVKAVGA